MAARDVVLVSTSSDRELRRRALPRGDGMLMGTWADADSFVVGGWRGTVNVLRASDLSQVAPPRLVAPGWITDLVTSPDGRLVASADTDRQLPLYDTASWRPLGKTLLQRQEWGWLSYAPDGRTLRGIFDDGGRIAMTMQPADWIRQACRLAARELTQERVVRHPPRPALAAHLPRLALINERQRACRSGCT